MEKDIRIGYSFIFQNGIKKEFLVEMDRETLQIIRKDSKTNPSWTRLDHHKCGICSLDPSHSHCPVAVNLVDIAEKFKEMPSHEEAVVNVTTEERVYSKYTSVQVGLSSLIGIIMATSGCPALDYLRPMARYHLPFATVSETVYRMVSMYVMAQYMLHSERAKTDWSLNGLERIYSEVHEVNRDFSKRLAETAKKDASVNAVMNLDCFACLVPLTAKEMIDELKTSFAPYLKPNPL